jgi:hypothetical protein
MTRIRLRPRPKPHRGQSLISCRLQGRDGGLKVLLLPAPVPPTVVVEGPEGDRRAYDLLEVESGGVAVYVENGIGGL